MGKQGEEETSGSEMPSRAYGNKAVMGAPPHTHPTLLSPAHPTRSGQSGQSPWSWADAQNRFLNGAGM